ncbi:transcription repressor OFP13-like [Rutidosis leptorrhynchoides]|uniref:transcription repressor OFP13-like n=1 Tax=Rutidosis leptorrhynchoides TaxID=125765 RepID=UPI003A998A7E
MKLIPSSLSLFNKPKETWLWPTCKNPKTLSFRASPNDTMFKTVNSVYFDPKYAQNVEAEIETVTPESCFTNSSESASISTESEEYFNTNEYSSVETIVRGARSERLFFEPGPTTSSILEGNKQFVNLDIEDHGGGDSNDKCDNNNGDIPYKESVATAIESQNPQEDFKKSMEEMVEMHGLKDWECLEELLGWFLKMNGKNHHEIIVGAFLDLLAGTSGGDGGDGGTNGGGGGDGGASTSDYSTASFISVASSFTDPLNFSLLSKVGEKEIIEEEKNTRN